ncbi:glutaredoxin family protein [Niallia alba]|uniref:thioredoxin family protein n=1 Tax=Niallia alba TaxID=2729105 RepID=UPI0039A20242
MKLLKLEKYNCPSCVKVSNVLNAMGVNYDQINVEDDPEVAGKYNIMSVPVTILEDNEGNELQRSIGYRPEELEEMISKLI